jgi:hypothetical protein
MARMCRIQQPAGWGIDGKKNFKAMCGQPIQALSSHDAAMSFCLITLAHESLQKEPCEIRYFPSK